MEVFFFFALGEEERCRTACRSGESNHYQNKQFRSVNSLRFFSRETGAGVSTLLSVATGMVRRRRDRGRFGRDGLLDLMVVVDVEGAHDDQVLDG